jgi:hypothetical protein
VSRDSAEPRRVRRVSHANPQALSAGSSYGRSWSVGFLVSRRSRIISWM